MSTEIYNCQAKFIATNKKGKQDAGRKERQKALTIRIGDKYMESEVRCKRDC